MSDLLAGPLLEVVITRVIDSLECLRVKSVNLWKPIPIAEKIEMIVLPQLDLRFNMFGICLKLTGKDIEKQRVRVLRCQQRCRRAPRKTVGIAHRVLR